MRIGIDCRTILNPETGHAAGVAHYTYHIVRALLREDSENEYVLFMDTHAEGRLKDELRSIAPGVELRRLPFHRLKRYLPFAYSHMILAKAFMHAKLDILHAPANTVPMYYRGKTVVTVHDLAIYDNPKWFPEALPGARTFSTRILVPWAVRRATRVIAVSEATKHDIVRFFGADAAKVTVVHEGADPPVLEGGGLESPSHAGILERFRVRQGRYMLYVGTIEPRKNIAGAVHAFVEAAARSDELADVGLIIAGRKGWKYDDVFAAIDEANGRLGGERVRYVGYLSADEKDALMRHAGAFVFPSFYEGFGLPVVEAMAHGVPVICSDAGSLPEVAGDAALEFDPEDMDGMADAMERIMTDRSLRREMVARGLLRAEAFSWGSAAKNTVQVYRDAYAA